MSIRDLGYRPYEGERLPAANNVWVLLRHGMRRAWSSLLVKLAVITCILPALAFVLVAFVITASASQQGVSPGEAVDAPKWVKTLSFVQLWAFAFPAAIGAGAAAIAEDLGQRAFQFYFAKPVTPAQYLAGRIGAVAVFVFAVTFVPCALLWVALVGLGGRELLVERAGIVVPILLHSLASAVVVSTTAVGISSLGKSRALTTSAFVILFLVPYVVSVLVFAIARFPWLELGSVPALLGVVGSALFKQPIEGDLSWAHALPALGIMAVLSTTLALHRLKRAEVIA